MPVIGGGGGGLADALAETVVGEAGFECRELGRGAEAVVRCVAVRPVALAQGVTGKIQQDIAGTQGVEPIAAGCIDCIGDHAVGGQPGSVAVGVVVVIAAAVGTGAGIQSVEWVVAVRAGAGQGVGLLFQVAVGVIQMYDYRTYQVKLDRGHARDG